MVSACKVLYRVKCRNAGVRLKTVSLSSLTLTFWKERLWSWHNCMIKEWQKAEKGKKEIKDKRRERVKKRCERMECASIFGLLSLSRWRTSLVPFLPPLHHLVLIGSDESWQTAGQQHPDQLWECNSKCYSSNNAHVSLNKGCHQLIAALLIDFGRCYGSVSQVWSVAVGDVRAAARRDSIHREINTGEPAGVVQDTTTTQTPLDVIHCDASLILRIVVLNGLVVRPQKGAFDLMTENKARDASDQLCQENQRQEHGVQFEHPWTPATCCEAAEQPEHDDGRPGPDEHIGSIGGVFSDQRDVRTQDELPP